MCPLYPIRIFKHTQPGITAKAKQASNLSSNVIVIDVPSAAESFRIFRPTDCTATILGNHEPVKPRLVVSIGGV